MKKEQWIGIAIIIVAILMLGDYTKLIDIKIFFDGWWTLFLIVPSFYNLIVKQSFKYLYIGLIGIVMLLAEQKIINGDIWILILIIGLFLYGLRLIARK